MLSVPHKIPRVWKPPAIHIPVFTDIFPSTFFVQMLSLITHYSILKAHYSKASGKFETATPLVFQTPLLCGRSKQRMKFVYSAALRRAVLRGWNFKIFHNFLFFAWVGNVPILDIWGSATESRALFSREKCLRPRKYHFSAVRNVRDWGNTIFQQCEMSATESPAHFSRLGRWKSSLTQEFQRTKIQVSLVPRCIPLLLSIDLAVGETIGFTNFVYKKSGQGFQICDYRSLHMFSEQQ